ncbi:hypothetical protein QLL95_gp0456 [Cotonvirus japonicus]|uniref:Uncharacterized protein n=1 Tax=Cotonvirus japonicus TaxID=2811091 RepID=A0ABM7NUC7_9VIRU|nr:hypothetical protein QLL95_gp0456 [Cotonvirus japonicus]BCS83667.1 hypothetical protein [Cotonvirus japonicus]
MKLKDFINFSVFENLDDDDEICLYILNCKQDNNHENIDSDNEHLIDKSEALLLINKARNSFISHIKLKDKYIKKYKTSTEDILETVFYLSNDKKFYCIFVNVFFVDSGEIYLFGLIEKETEKHLIIGYDKGSLFILHHLFNCLHFNKYTTINIKNNEQLTEKSKALDIIDILDDYFNNIYENRNKFIFENLSDTSESDNLNE